jgi:excinuclease ABC subunit A
VSATGQYLRPMLERASVKPVVVESKPKRTSRKMKMADADQPDLIGAK